MAHEFDGKKYESASTHQREWGTRLIDELSLAGDESVLDLGCGDGTLTRQIAERVPRGEVLGIDASQGMVDAALSKAQDNLCFRKLEINDLAFEGRFDLVFSNAALHWVKDHRRLLRNVRRALRPGGRLRFNFAGDGNCTNLYTVVRSAMARDAYRPCFVDFCWPWYMPPLEAYRALVASSGLSEARVWGENADRFFPNAEAMIAWRDQPSLVPFLAVLPEPERTAFRDLVVSEMIRETQQAEGRCFETFSPHQRCGRPVGRGALCLPGSA
jgi:trans-aconitate methyltransferase